MTRLFADDCLVYTTVTEEEDMTLLQADLKSLESWQETWKMSFNPAKCSVLKISNKRTPPTREYAFCGQVLQHTTSQPYLGVNLDNKLSWGNHVDNTVAKASRTLGFLRRNLWFCPKEVKTFSLHNLSETTIGIRDLCLGPIQEKQINKLERVQRKAARFALGTMRGEAV